MDDTTSILSDESLWFDLDRTATLEGVSRQAILKKLTNGGYPPQLTRKVPCRNGEKWQIHMNALSDKAQLRYMRSKNETPETALIEAEVDRQTEGPLWRFAHAEDRHQERALKVARWTREFMALATKKEQIAYAGKHFLSLRTLYAWARKARMSGGEPAPSLYIYGGNNRAGHRAYSEDLINAARELYLQKTAPTAETVQRILTARCASDGHPAPSRATVYRWMSNPDIVPPSLATMGRQGMRVYRDKNEAVLLRDWSKVPVNGCWIGDHHVLDVFVLTDDGRIVRPWATTWLDAHSRLQIGYWLCETPSGDTIALALRHGILPKQDGHPGEGTPESVLCDNGKDYKGHQLNGEVTSCFKQTEDLPVFGLFAELGIRRRWTKTYSARSKAPKERSYGVIEQRYCRHLPGYCGSNPKSRPEHLQADIEATQRWVKTGGAEGERKLLFWWEFEEVFARIVKAYNHHHHSKLGGKSPAEVWEERRPLTVPIPRKDTLDILVLRSDTRQIHNYGIQIAFRQAPRETVCFHDQALYGMIGQTVQVRYNPFDRTSILVLSKGELLCRAARHDDAPAFAETQEEKARLAAHMEATAEQRRAFEAYLDNIQQPGLLAFLAGDGQNRVRPLRTRAQKHRYDQAGEEAAAIPATFEQSRAVGDLLEWNFQKQQQP